MQQTPLRSSSADNRQCCHHLRNPPSLTSTVPPALFRNVASIPHPPSGRLERNEPARRLAKQDDKAGIVIGRK
jgi:hypothetical protein